MDYRELQKTIICKRCKRTYQTLLDLDSCDEVCGREDCFDVYIGKKHISVSKQNNMVT
jgi:hypothetical protein